MLVVEQLVKKPCCHMESEGHCHVRLEVLVALAVNIVVIWDVMPCDIMDVCCLYLVTFQILSRYARMFLLLSLTFLLSGLFTRLLYRHGVALSRNNV
jgi:hypothetical protein